MLAGASPPFDVRRLSGALGSARPRAAAGLCGQDLFWIVLAGAIAAAVLLVFRPNRLALRQAEAECRLLRQEIAGFQARVEHLRGWERALASGDPSAWAAIARERLGWLAPGEEVSGPPRMPGRPTGERLARVPSAPYWRRSPRGGPGSTERRGGGGAGTSGDTCPLCQ